MLPNIERGTSFKGVTAYLLHDKRESAAKSEQTSNRVGFTKVLNFIGDEARNPAEAAKAMALTVRDADYLKAAAGIKPGGRKAEKPAVWHTSLSWHPSEQVNQAEMMRAVEDCLAAVGLGLDKGYQTYVVQHTEEPQPHVHIVVNLVHPLDGRQANPYRDQPKAQAWGLKYEKERGAVFCKAREEKYGDRTPEQAAFNSAAQAAPAAERKPDRFGRSRDRQPRPPRQEKASRAERQARNGAGNDNLQEEEAAARIKAEIRARYAALEKASREGFMQRREESIRFYQERKDGRSAIFGKYAAALDAVWNGTTSKKWPDQAAARRVSDRLDSRREAFEAREKSLIGRYTNAVKLAPQRGLMGTVSLALNARERARLFEQSQRAITARPPARTGAQPSKPEPKKVQSDRLKAMRTAALASHDRQTAALTGQLKDHHAASIQAEKDARAELARMAAAAWQHHAETYGRKPDGGHITDSAVRVIEALTTQHSTFSRADLTRFVTAHAPDAQEAQAAIARVQDSPELVRLGKDGQGRERFTARDLQSLEQRMMEDAISLQDRAAHPVNARHQKQAVASAGVILGAEQEAAFQHVVAPSGLVTVVGFAGSGKSTMLGAARDAWERQGYRVRGAALSGVATDGLQAGAGIESQTIHARLHQWDRGRDMLTGNDVLVIDEAGMIGSRLMGRILAHAREAGAKVVLAGDPEQLQAIEAGAAFRAITERAGTATITAIRRQREDWQQEATRDLAMSRVAKALNRYERAGMVHQHGSQADAKAELVKAWDTARREQLHQAQIILAYTRSDVRELNEQARETLRAAGQLGTDRTLQTAQGSREFAEGDRLYFLKNDRGLGVRNGTLGTIEAIGGGSLTVRLDGGGRQVTVNLAEYSHIDHGYAATVHKSQGVTVDRTHVLATRHMDSHAAYVGMTRHRDRVDVHWSAEEFSSRASLTRTFSRRRAKDTSLDYEGDAQAENRAVDAGKASGGRGAARNEEAAYGSSAGQGRGDEQGDAARHGPVWTQEEIASFRQAQLRAAAGFKGQEAGRDGHELER